MSYRYKLEKGTDLNDGLRLNGDLVLTYRLIPGRSMGTAVQYEVRIGGRDFECCSYDDAKARNGLIAQITDAYQRLLRWGTIGGFTADDTTLRGELSDLITAIPKSN